MTLRSTHLSLETAAEVLGLDTDEILRHVAQGELKPWGNDPGSYLFPAEEVETFLNRSYISQTNARQTTVRGSRAIRESPQPDGAARAPWTGTPPRCVAVDCCQLAAGRPESDPEVARRLIGEETITMLRLLAEAGYRLILSANTKPGQSRVQAMRTAGILDLFTGVLESHDMGFAKPEPTFYELICMTADCQPEQIVHAGGHFNRDVTAPTRFGMRAVWISRTTRALTQHIPVIASIADLPKCLPSPLELP